MTTFADISHHQGTVDLAAYRRAGHDRIILKATEGTRFVDPTFADRWRRAGQLGLARVAYHYAEAQDGGAAQFDRFLAAVNAAGGFGPRDLPCLDVEDVDDGQADYRRADDNAREFTTRAVARGFTSGLLYTGRWYADPAKVTAAVVPPGWRQLWLSHYDTTVPDQLILLPSGWIRDQLVARQYTDRATVAGVATRCDYSRLLRDWLPPTIEEDTMAAADIEAINKHIDATYRMIARGEVNGKIDPAHEKISLSAIRRELDELRAVVERSTQHASV